ncbi:MULTISPECIES: TnsA endonuclease N-terminal domain-containing protein [Thalassospira]|uniref:TnsA endonuclease N-terminal domain-containing protein n=1 Tax=Thalassospira profundimaris TaxID=502049 RepID=A0A367VM89_9PROT|nr:MULTISPECIES: TnsA endonuclease N-terminal domain-containing protein [Thalassospira]KZB70814.1 hypothetical protein AUQ43_08105 [Thalassospira sp. MCCC 1A01148]RCK25551.1 hypothetical protein TH6_02770 [Thalassospira profundimaris]
MKPVRQVVSRSKGRVHGLYYSRKAKRLLPWESQLERDALIILDLIPEVDDIAVQPFKLTYQFDGRDRVYFPDILITGGFGQKVIEVKPKRDLGKPENLKRFPVIETVLAEKGYQFEIWTEDDIRREPRRSNVKSLSPHRLSASPKFCANRFRGYLRSSGNCLIRDLVEIIGDEATLEDALTLVATGQLKLNLDEKIGMMSTVELVDEGAGK